MKVFVWRQMPSRASTDNTNLRGRITEWLTSCLFCLNEAALFMLNEQHFYLFGQILTIKLEVSCTVMLRAMESVLCLVN